MHLATWILAALGILFGVAVIALVVADITLIKTGQASISHRIWQASKTNPLLPALVGMLLGLVSGVLLGHFFWQIK